MSIRTAAVEGLVSRGGVYVTIYNSMPCTGDNNYIYSELHQFDYDLNNDNDIILTGTTNIIGNSVDWETGNEIVSGSIVMTDVSGVTGYLENEDYTIDYSSGTITRLITGKIEDLDIVKVDYTWHLDCPEEKTGNPSRFCNSCKDPDQGNVSTGVIYYQSTTVRALFHIPKYQGDFDKLGVFKLGDGIVSVPYNITVNAKNYSDGGFFCQDKIKIQGVEGVWKVMSMPATIQMGEFLGKKIHVRKIDY